MKARVKATGEIIEVYPSIHKGCDYDGSDGCSYVKEDIIILDDEPDYWDKILHQYAGMAMQGMLSNPSCENLITKAIVKEDIATALVEKLKKENKL